MRNFLLLLCLFIISVESKSQIGYCEFPENSKIENWKNLEYISGNGTIINLGLKQGTYLIHWKFQVDSIFWKSQKVLHIGQIKKVSLLRKKFGLINIKIYLKTIFHTILKF